MKTLTVRHYHPADFCEINSWCIEHTGHDMHPGLLPPMGIVVEDASGPCCAIFAHLSCNIGVAFIEDPVTRPGMGLRAVRQAFFHAFGALREALKSLNYTHMVAYASSAQAREMARNYGFRVTCERFRMEGLV